MKSDYASLHNTLHNVENLINFNHNRDNSTISPEEASLKDWLSKLKLLHGVPFNYLVPDEQMLPQESIRFFYCDLIWLDSLLEGALSLGRSTASDMAQDSAFFPNMRELVREGTTAQRKKVFGHLLNHFSISSNLASDTTPITPNEKVTGFLLRSGVVKGWPGLEVEGFGDAQQKNLLPILRMDHLSPNILLCLFSGTLVSVRIHEHPETLHFGVDPSNTEPQIFSKSFRYVVDVNGHAAGTAVDTHIAPPLLITDFQRPTNNGVIKMNALAQAIQKTLSEKINYTGPFTAAEFALEMVEGVESVNFILNTGMEASPNQKNSLAQTACARRPTAICKTQLEPRGLVAPMNIEALCVGVNPGAIFEPAPYDFSQLPNAGEDDIPNLSDKVMTGGLVNLQSGIHLHWALPDGLTHGQSPQDSTGNIIFPASPDRWLISRVFTDLANPNQPVNHVKSWVVESNYYSATQPDATRPSITVPFKSDDKDQPFRFLGRVQEYEQWVEREIKKKAGFRADDDDNYISGLSAVGYGTAEFSASYHTCKSNFGFYDTDIDLKALGEPGKDKLLTYQVIGWYSQDTDDPFNQLPLQLDPAAFKDILNKISQPTDQTIFKNAYLQTNISDGPYILINNLSTTVQMQLVSILMASGYDFLQQVLERYQWSLPSATLESNPSVNYTLLSGMITGIIWNETRDYFDPLKSGVNIAVGNTPSEALSALIASLSGLQSQPDVEWVLNALQLGVLDQVTNATELSNLENLSALIHKSTFGSLKSGSLWQVTVANPDQKKPGEVTLPQSLADELNQLNLYQQSYDEALDEIQSMRTQIFMDWYRFMLIFHRGPYDPTHNLDPDQTATCIFTNVTNLNDKIANTKPDQINDLADKIKNQLPPEYALTTIAAPRFWQPNDPVVLFQGENINPPQRYGGDGRFMADDSLFCRLTDQLVNQITVPANVLGNTQTLVFNAENMPGLSASIPLSHSQAIHDVFTENCLLNPNILAAQSLNSGASGDFTTTSLLIKTDRDCFLTPSLPAQITATEFAMIENLINAEDSTFLQSLYIQNDNNYILQKSIDQLTTDEKLRLEYIFVSSGRQWGMSLQYSGLGPSCIFLVEWNGTPWLPFSLSWEITYYPLFNVNSDAGQNINYPSNFITENYTLGDVSYTAKQPLIVPTDFQIYKNKIFLTPHAEINFQEKIQQFIDSQPTDPLDPELQAILDNMKNFPPILSQSLSGFNDELSMRSKVMQLQVRDPVPSGYYQFSNTTIKNAVADMTHASPSTSNCYNPIRAGIMSISSLTIVDVFGRNIKIQTPDKVIVAQNMQMEGLPVNNIYLTPRIVQPSRLLFRWLSADNDAVEMNSHPATTPIFCWIICNHLDSSLWLYDNQGLPLGSLILSEDFKQVIWQCVPGGGAFDMDINDFFSIGPGKNVHPQLKKFAIALYNNQDSSYLNAFMRSIDTTSTLIQPQNYKQFPSNAVLMGQPIALAQARLTYDLQSLPVYSQSWADFESEVNQAQSKNTHGFTNVQFPIRLGALNQMNDGMLGYFKNGDYSHYYTLATQNPTDKVSIPDETNIQLSLDPAASSTQVTILLDPRGNIHATTGILPVGSVNIPPDQYKSALQNLELAFLITPILSSNTQLAFPVPTESGGNWTWLENEKTNWTEAKEIAKIDDSAKMGYSPQVVKEGWLKLTGFVQEEN